METKGLIVWNRYITENSFWKQFIYEYAWYFQIEWYIDERYYFTDEWDTLIFDVNTKEINDMIEYEWNWIPSIIEYDRLEYSCFIWYQDNWTDNAWNISYCADPHTVLFEFSVGKFKDIERSVKDYISRQNYEKEIRYIYEKG